MTTTELDKLKSKLPRNYRMLLWQRLNNVSLSAISAVLRGDYDNFDIINAAIELAEEHQVKLRTNSDKLKEL